MTLWINVITVLVWILVPATPLSVYHDCLPERKWSRRWEGSHVEMTVWLTEESVMTDPEQSLLTFTMEPIGSSRPYDYDVLYINRRQVKIVRVRNGRLVWNVLSLLQPLPVGWATFNLSSTSLTELWLLPHTHLVSFTNDVTIASLNIDGSNITVGCHHNVFGWEVVDGGAVTMPLPHRHRHYLSMYSNTTSQPRLTLGDTTIQLGWDGSTLFDVTRYENKHQKPLPAATEHHFVFSCNSSHAEDVICNIEAGKKILKTVNLGELPTSVTFQEKSEEQFYVFYHRVNDNVTDDSVSSSAAGDDGDHRYESYLTAAEFLSVLVFVILIIDVVFTWRHFTQKKRDQATGLKNADSSEEKLLQDKDQESDENVDTLLLRNAIIDGKTDRVKTLLRQTDNRHDAYVEAHIQAKKDIIQIISVKKNEGTEIPDNNLISRVLNVLQQRINKVFRAASVGIYRGEGGVKTLLESYGLPGTIRDKRGCSLLHYIAETLNEDGSPVWSYDDIKDYLNSEEYYINAVDYKGQTVLHTLAGHLQSSKKVMWDEKDQPLEDVWCAMAKRFIKEGCNPTLRNHSGRSPVDIALDKGATKFVGILRKNSQYFKFDFEQKTERHSELVSAAGEGDAKTMQRLLKTGVPLLPMAARADPLLHAIRHNQRDAAFLLLSAGAPLCNQSIEDLTPLEGAHNTLGLPAVFPALIRMAYSEKIQMEIQTLKDSKITGKEEDELFQAMESYQKTFKISGNFSKFILESNNYEERSKKARDLLCTAAIHGLSLTCVLLGLEDVCIHPLQNEENPFKLAFLGNHFDTQVTLCRDMNMVPFTFSLPPSAILPADLLQEYWANERKVLKDICSGKHDDTKLNKYETNILKKYIEQLSKVKSDEDLEYQDITLERPDDFFLYLLAKHDLVYILFILCEKFFKDMDINRVVEPFSECTMLHVASVYGCLNMIEYLLYRNPELDKVTLGKYSAAHLAAIGGHKECYQYILARMNDVQKEMKCNIQLTAADLMKKYEEFCSNCQMPLMTREEALHVKNETEDGKRAHELLYIKGNYLKITKPDDLIDAAVNNMCEEKKVNEIKDKIKIETDKLLESIEDKKFKGKTILTGPLMEGNEIFHINYVDFMYEVSPEYDIMCKSSESPGKGTIIAKDLPLKGSTFREEFAKHIKKAIKNYVSKSSDKSDISVAPPFLLHTHKGVYIRWVWNHKYFCLLTSYIVPTLKAKLSTIDKEEFVFITNIYDGWILRKYQEENKYFKHLTTDDRKIWLVCRLLRKLTLQLWFAPRFNTKRYTQSWNTWSVGIEGLEERILKQLFKDEKSASTEWDKKSVFDRVMSVYSRAVNKESGKWVPRPDDDFHGKASSVCGILEYLESLKKNNNF